jgi:tetratricopeptide (TPR) repeat protein
MTSLPTEPHELILQANEAEQLGDLEQAFRQLEAAAAALMAARVRLLHKLGQSWAAAQGLEDLPQADSPSLAALLAKAEACRADGDGAAALASYRQILELVPGHPAARGAEWILSGAEIALAEPQPSAADSAIAFSVEDAIAAAERAYAAGDFQLALDRFEQALGARPGDPNLEAAIARCLRRQGEINRADQLLGGILERHPHNFPALIGRAELLVHCGDHGKAVHW